MNKYNLLFNVGIYLIAFIGYVWTKTILTPHKVDVNYNLVTMDAPVAVTLTCSYSGVVDEVLWDLDAGEGVFKREGVLTYMADNSCKNSGYVDSRYSYKCYGKITYHSTSWTINNITANNDGDRWKCTTVVANSEQESNVALINVRVPIKSVTMTTPTDDIITVAENTEVSFVCQTSKGYPSADITWYKSDAYVEIIGTNTTTFSSDMDKFGLSNSTGMITFYPQSSDNGMIIYCLANNTEKLWKLPSRKPRLNVLFNTTISSFVVEGHTGYIVHVDEHTSPVLVCSVDSNPPSTTSIRIQFHGKILKEEENSTQLTHGLTNVSSGDIGVYRCFAGNDLITEASSTKELILCVKCQPQPYEDFTDTVYSVLHNTATLWVYSIAYPPINDTCWAKDNVSINFEMSKYSKTLDFDQRPDFFFNVAHVALSIANVDESDFGEYTVYISNSMGTLEKTIVLKPEDTRDPGRQHGTLVGVAVGVAVGVIILIGLVVAAVVFVLRRRRATNGSKSDDQTANRSSNKQDAMDTTPEDGDEYDVISDEHSENPNNNDAVYYNEGIELNSANQRNNDTTYYNEGANVNPYEALSQPGQDPVMYTSLDASCEDKSKVNSDETNMEYEYVGMGMEKL